MTRWMRRIYEAAAKTEARNWEENMRKKYRKLILAQEYVRLIECLLMLMKGLSSF